MAIKRLMSRIDQGFVSRDYGWRLRCENINCYLNNGYECAAPATIKITKDGRCAEWIKSQRNPWNKPKGKQNGS